MSTLHRLTREKTGCHRLLAAALITVMTAACGSSPPSLAFAEGTPSDLQELSKEVWVELLAVFPNQSDCIGEVTLEGDWNLEGVRAFYLPDDAKVVLKIPGAAAHLRHSLIHELAHHMEHVCPDHLDLRDAFIEAQGLLPGAAWFDGPSWEQTPSEQFAEAVVRLVLSRPVMHYRLSLTEGVMETVREWGGGR